jgi:carbamate kinase
MTIAEAQQYLSEGHFAPGSMEPKIKAAMQYLQQTKGEVIITSPRRMVAAVKGIAGTRITAR